VPGATAIAKGLATGHSADKPGYWIHVSGTSILTWYDNQHQRYGEGPLPEQKYHDMDDIQRLVTLPDGAHHRNVDKIVQTAISDAVKVAILCPPTIYGTGSGAVNTRSLQVPDMVAGTLDKGFAPIVSPGLTEWDNVHVQDLGELFLKLVEATQDPSLRDNPEIFGLNGYFFAEGGTHRWSDVARWIAEEASKQGYLPEPMTKFVTQKVGQRASKYLGWKPKGPSLKEEIPNLVAQEANARGFTPKEKKG
jgi:nucleoside-diphosphate-sugar epimerase